MNRGFSYHLRTQLSNDKLQSLFLYMREENVDALKSFNDHFKLYLKLQIIPGTHKGDLLHQY